MVIYPVFRVGACNPSQLVIGVSAFWVQCVNGYVLSKWVIATEWETLKEYGEDQS